MNMQEIEKLALQFENDADKVSKELKRIQSVKCRLKKQKGRQDYDSKMTDALQYEQLLKEAKALLVPASKSVTQFDESDIQALDYDETVKAIRSIQSKKTLTRWLTEEEGNNDEFRRACQIEKLLVAHRKTMKPVEDGLIRKSELIAVIETIESSGKLSQAKVLALLHELVSEG